jgi:hypothetical protein
MRGTSQVQAKCMRGTCVVQARYELPQSQPKTGLKPKQSAEKARKDRSALVTRTDALKAPGSGLVPKSRKPKAERNPKAEARTHCAACRTAANVIKPYSDFGFRASFGFRSSVFGPKGRRFCPRCNRSGFGAALDDPGPLFGGRASAFSLPPSTVPRRFYPGILLSFWQSAPTVCGIHERY